MSNLGTEAPEPKYSRETYPNWETFLVEWVEWQSVLLRPATKKIRESQKRNWKLNRYGKDTPAWYDRVLAEQEGMCAICADIPKEELFVDHCHATGKKRALLCRQCNSGLGMFRDDPALMRIAAEYLEGHREL